MNIIWAKDFINDRNNLKATKDEERRFNKWCRVEEMLKSNGIKYYYGRDQEPWTTAELLMQGNHSVLEFKAA